MKSFEYYLEKGNVKKVSPDTELALSLKDDAVKRAEKIMGLSKKEFSKIIFENIYDSIREILDAILAVEGYKSYSHEASIAFLKNLGVEESVLLEIDDFRCKRNSSKYYGKDLEEDDAEDIVNFYNKYSDKLIDLFEQLFKKLNNRLEK